MNFRVFDTMDEVIRAAAADLVNQIEKNDRTVVALSGGSTPKTLYEMLGRSPLRERIAGCQVVWVTGDERCVPPDDAQSNSRMIRQSLFAEGVAPKHKFLRFRAELGKPEAIAADFEKEWKALDLAGIDVAILGMGEDGHTASLFPGTTAIDEKNGTATAVWVPRLESWRVTMTLPVLRAAKTKWVLAGGAGKKPMLERIRAGEEFPVAMVTESGSESWWYVDQAAYPGAA